MMHYPKIDTLWNRDEKTFKVIPGAFRLHEFAIVKRWMVMEKVDGCLHYTARVTTDRGSLPVGKIVNARLPVKVASYNTELNRVEYRDIHHYHKEPVTRPFLAVTVGSRLKGNRPKTIVCTENHPFFVDGEWIPACDLKAVKNAAHLADSLSDGTKQVIAGMLLGDAHIYRPSDKSRGFGFLHALSQSGYFDYKMTSLAGIVKEVAGGVGGYPGSQPNRRANSIVTPAISDFILRTCEVDGRKRVTAKWLDYCLPLALAIWYMDDGACHFSTIQRPRARISTNGFSVEEVEMLRDCLRERYGIGGDVFNYHGPTLVLDADGTERLFSLIYPYVPTCMKYKLPTRYADAPCVTWLGDADKHGTLDARILSVSSKVSEWRKLGACQYDLTVDGNSNYFANSILVHNTNIRVHLHADGSVTYGGRTDEAQLYAPLVEWLHSHLPAEVVALAFDPGTEAVLYGEGYGPRIQKGGGNYRADVSFCLFDVAVLTPVRVWWLNWMNVEDVALKLGIGMVPVLARNATLDEAMTLVKMPSMVAHYDGGIGCEQEGIVCRTDPLLFTRNGSRLIWKLKGRDLA